MLQRLGCQTLSITPGQKRNVNAKENTHIIPDDEDYGVGGVLEYLKLWRVVLDCSP
jgi:hypothetical protein